MKQVFLPLVAMLCSLLVAPSAHALYQMQGNVREFWHTGGIMRVLICSGSSCTWFWYDPKKVENESLTSLLIVARADGSNIWVGGTDNTYDSWPQNGARLLQVFHLKAP